MLWRKRNAKDVSAEIEAHVEHERERLRVTENYGRGGGAEVCGNSLTTLPEASRN